MPSTRPTLIPPGGAIRTSDAGAFETTRALLRTREIQHPFTGVSSRGLDLDAVVDLCRAYEPLLRADEAFSHTTAALLYGAPLPPSQRAPSPLHIVSGSVTRARTKGVVGHRALAGLPPRRLEHGLPVVAPEIMWLQLASMLDRRDLTAVGDFLVTGTPHARPAVAPIASVERLRTIVESSSGCRGVATARWALDHIRRGAASRPETLLRLLVVESGLPEPAIGVEVPVLGGRVVLHPDLAYPELRIAIEYEGGRHREAMRWERDIERRELFEDAGWRVIRVTKQALFGQPDAVISRIRRARRARAAD